VGCVYRRAVLRTGVQAYYVSTSGMRRSRRGRMQRSREIREKERCCRRLTISDGRRWTGSERRG
jgi:hypothetical protein